MSASWAFDRKRVFPDVKAAPKVSRDRSADAIQLFKQGVRTLAAALARLRAGDANWHDSLAIVFGDAEIGYPAREVVRRFAEKSAYKFAGVGYSSVGEARGVSKYEDPRLRKLREIIRRIAKEQSKHRESRLALEVPEQADG